MHKIFIFKMILVGQVDFHHPSSYQPWAESSVKSATALSNESCYVKEYNWNVTEWKSFPTALSLSL